MRWSRRDARVTARRMHRSLAILLLPALAFARPTKHVTTIATNVEGDTDDLTLSAAFSDETREKLDACWRTASRAKVHISIERGKITAVRIVENGDRRATGCIAKALHAAVLVDAPDSVVAT